MEQRELFLEAFKKEIAVASNEEIVNKVFQVCLMEYSIDTFDMEQYCNAIDIYFYSLYVQELISEERYLKITKLAMQVMERYVEEARGVE